MQSSKLDHWAFWWDVPMYRLLPVHGCGRGTAAASTSPHLPVILCTIHKCTLVRVHVYTHVYVHTGTGTRVHTCTRGLGCSNTRTRTCKLEYRRSVHVAYFPFLSSKTCLARHAGNAGKKIQDRHRPWTRQAWLWNTLSSDVGWVGEVRGTNTATRVYTCTRTLQWLERQMSLAQKRSSDNRQWKLNWHQLPRKQKSWMQRLLWFRVALYKGTTLARERSCVWLSSLRLGKGVWRLIPSAVNSFGGCWSEGRTQEWVLLSAKYWGLLTGAPNRSASWFLDWTTLEKQRFCIILNRRAKSWPAQFRQSGSTSRPCITNR